MYLRFLRALRARTYLVAAVAFFLFAEVGIRALGMLDFPLYDIHNTIGYLPKASQEGTYLLTRKWAFNNRSMATARNYAPSSEGILIIGDSIVYGGNPYREEDRVGHVLAALRPEDVWSVAAGGWSLKNELAYISLHSEELQALRHIVFVVNSGDFNVPPAAWRCEETHPTDTPNVALWYALKKHVLNPSECIAEDIHKVPDFDLKKALVNLHAAFGTRVQFIFYPDATEVRQPNLGKASFTKYSEYLASVGFEKTDWIGSDARWQIAFYRDEIHPTYQGNKVLAKFVSESIDKYK